MLGIVGTDQEAPSTVGHLVHNRKDVGAAACSRKQIYQCMRTIEF